MWFTMSRTVHSEHGVLFPSWSSFTLSTIRVVSSTTRCNSSTLMGPPPVWPLPAHRLFVADLPADHKECPGMSDPAELQARADSLTWFHSIDLGNGVKT